MCLARTPSSHLPAVPVQRSENSGPTSKSKYFPIRFTAPQHVVGNKVENRRAPAEHTFGKRPRKIRKSTSVAPYRVPLCVCVFFCPHIAISSHFGHRHHISAVTITNAGLRWVVAPAISSLSLSAQRRHALRSQDKV